MSEEVEKVFFKATDFHMCAGRDLISEYGLVEMASVWCSNLNEIQALLVIYCLSQGPWANYLTFINLFAWLKK